MQAGRLITNTVLHQILNYDSDEQVVVVVLVVVVVTVVVIVMTV